MKTETKLFGMLDGNEIRQYFLENVNGMVVKIINYGATITSISIPGEGGKRIELACGFDTLEGYFSEEYKANAPYFGCTVGRTCGMIKDGSFSLEGTKYMLAQNAGSNQLHGGITGFDKKVWEGSLEGDSVTMKLLSPHMDEGYPGNVDVTVVFRLTEDNNIEMSYNASSDRPTPLSLTNHTYFNLSGFKEDIRDHLVTVNSGSFLTADDTGAVTGGTTPVKGSPTDLQEQTRLGDAIDALVTGFEHFYIFGETMDELVKTAQFEHSATGRALDIYTTEPCMLLYTGRYTADNLKRENGDQYGQFRAFCCEAHRYPNGPNLRNAPGAITTPDTGYQAKTVFAFSF